VNAERVNLRAVIVGFGVALAITLPVALLARVAVDDPDADSAWATTVAVTSLLAAGLGGFITGRIERAHPVFNGSLAGGTLYVVMRVVVSIASGEVPNAVSLVLAVLLYISVGALGGSLASMRRGSSVEDVS
jgi:putative membrane protein (TIGR04086 family)